jgi:Heparinase II/III-like protein/Heparinase II/III N-terminus
MTVQTVAAGLRPRSVFRVTEAHYRDMAVAEDVCRGRFTELGRTLELGTEPDWLGADLPADREWQIAWSKFYYGLDLAHAFRQTGEARFLEVWEGLVRGWIRQVPVGFDASDVAARRVQNWIYAWDLFATAPAFRELAPGFAEELLAGLTEQTLHIREHLTPARNHRTLELYALFVFGLSFPGHVPGLLEFAIAQLDRNLAEEVRRDGVHVEASTHYHCIVLRSFVGARENARRFGVELPPGFDANLARACEFAAHTHRPDGWITTFSDADDGSYLDVLALAADLLGRPDLRYVATRGERGTAPRERNVLFASGGYHVQRSGWGESRRFGDERHLMFDFGPLGAGGHGHYDLLSVEAFGAGRRLLVDPGRYTYDERPAAPDDPPNPRHWFKGTAAHNTVCVDGLDQTPYCRSRPRRGAAEGRLLDRHTAPSLDIVRAEAASPAYDAVHTRRVAFVADEYWIVEDRLRGATPHRYDLRWHLAPEAHGAVTVDGRAVRAPGLALVVAAGAGPVLEDGWCAPEYGVKQPAPVVSVAVDGATEASFITLIVPRDGDGDAAVPDLRVLRANGRTVVEVDGAGPDGEATDVVAWTDAGLPLVFGPVECRAECAWLREPGGGAPPVLRACSVTEVRGMGGRTTIFRSPDAVSWLAWVGHEDGSNAVSWA